MRQSIIAATTLRYDKPNDRIELPTEILFFRDGLSIAGESPTLSDFLPTLSPISEGVNS